MLIRDFEYFSPQSIEEACSFLSDHNEEARALAGGQSLIPLMKLSLVTPKFLVDLKRIPNLSNISRNEESLSIGALSTYSEIERSALVRSTIPILKSSVSKIGYPQVRNRGTIGGSLSHADPAADLIPTMLVLDATFTVTSKKGSRRRIRASDFFKGPFSTSLGKGEILESVQIPIQDGSVHSFRKLTLGHGDFPLVVVSVLAKPRGGAFEDVRIALGGVADKPYRATAAEGSIKGKDFTESAISEAARVAAESSSPGDDLDVTSNYKKRMVEVLLRRALISCSRG